MSADSHTAAHSTRAVSPVIGVVLMVAVTIILAAVIGTFVLGLSPSETRTATATIGIEGEAGADNVTIVHRGGDPLELDDTSLVVDGATATGATGLSGTLNPGERAVIENVGASGETTVALRHDPSGEIVAEADATIE